MRSTSRLLVVVLPFVLPACGEKGMEKGVMSSIPLEAQIDTLRSLGVRLCPGITHFVWMNR